MSIQLHPSILTEAFLYFAKFPLLEGVVSSIFRTGNPAVDGYAALKNQVLALNTNSLLPGIKNLLFSSNEEKLKQSIEDTAGIFMLLDYGQLSCSQDQIMRLNDEIEFGIIIARKIDAAKFDLAEIILMQDELLNLMRQVRATMIEDSKYHPFVKQINFPHQINPWYARELQNATGFSMTFSKTGIDMI